MNQLTLTNPGIGKRFQYFCQLYWRQILTGTVLACILLAAGTSYAYAKFQIYEGADAYTHADGLLPLAFGMLDDIIGSTATQAEKAIDLKITSDSVQICGITIQGAGTLINILNQELQNIAVTICSILFLVGLLNSGLHQQTSAELFVKRLIGYGLSVGLIYMSMDITLAINDIGVELAQMVTDNMSVDSSTQAIIDVKNNIYHDCFPPDSELDGFWDSFVVQLKGQLSAFGYIIQLTVPWIASKIIYIMTYMACFARGITLAVMAAFAPLSFSDLTGERGAGLGSAGKYIKNVACVALQGAIIAFAILFATYGQIAMLDPDSTENLFGSLPGILALGFAEAGICMRSQSIAKEIIV